MWKGRGWVLKGRGGGNEKGQHEDEKTTRGNCDGKFFRKNLIKIVFISGGREDRRSIAEYRMVWMNLGKLDYEVSFFSPSQYVYKPVVGHKEERRIKFLMK